MADRVELVEVSPRDGLQNESTLVATADKLELIARARAAGFSRIEATSFVNPKKVPQMADSEAVFAGADRAGLSVLALNARGVERALAAGAREINYVFVATDEFSVRNNGAPTFETLAIWPDVYKAARAAGARVAVTIGAAFGCPFEGETPIARLAAVAERICVNPPDELSLADTIGVGSPADVRARFAAMKDVAPPHVRLRAHFHDTRHTGIANAIAAYETGVRLLDSSLGGVGGCPFAPGAAGNVASEDIVYVFERMGVRTGIDLAQAADAARWILDKLGRAGAGVALAGGFPLQTGAGRAA